MNVLKITLLCLVVTACNSQKKSNIIGVKSGGEYYAVDHAAKDALTRNDESERLVCKRHQVTGTRFKQKRCTTKKQAEKDRLAGESKRERNHSLANRILTAEKGGDG